MDGPPYAQARAWGASGLAHLTGLPDGPPDFSRAAVLEHARAVAAQFSARTGVEVDTPAMLAGRAALLGLTRGGQVSAGGATRLLPTAGGWCAITLSRPDDIDAVPALVEADVAADVLDDPWRALETWAAGRPADEAVERARLLDLPAAALGEAPPADPVVRSAGRVTHPRDPSGLLVVDMSSMWAGPSCARLLGRAGATVVKVESRGRPDGTRSGPRAFFDWMNGGKLCYTADFTDTSRLRALLSVADVVIEASRPAGLARRGLGPDDVPARDGRVWLSITGYGADGDGANRVAFGDDAAVAGGLVGRSARGPVFCADAVADPLTGLHAALAVVDALRRGGGEIVQIAMAAVAAGYAALPALPGEWRVPGDRPVPVYPPVAPAPAPRASELGADNAQVDRLIDERRLAPC
jgi:hypothetical protein